MTGTHAEEHQPISDKEIQKLILFSKYFEHFGILEDDLEIARITAADYNPQTGKFDGRPFETAIEGKALDSFFNAFKIAYEQGGIKDSNVGCTDYATWNFFDKDMVCTNYGPGDFIFWTKKYGLVPMKR